MTKTLLRRIHFECADQTKRFVLLRPRQRNGIRPPLPFDGHSDLIIGYPVKVPLVVLGQMLDNINRMKVVGRKLL